MAVALRSHQICAGKALQPQWTYQSTHGLVVTVKDFISAPMIIQLSTLNMQGIHRIGTTALQRNALDGSHRQGRVR